MWNYKQSESIKVNQKEKWNTKKVTEFETKERK